MCIIQILHKTYKNSRRSLEHYFLFSYNKIAKLIKTCKYLSAICDASNFWFSLNSEVNGLNNFWTDYLISILLVAIYSF